MPSQISYFRIVTVLLAVGGSLASQLCGGVVELATSNRGLPQIRVDGRPFQPIGWVLDAEMFWNSYDQDDLDFAYLDWLAAHGYNTVALSFHFQTFIRSRDEISFRPLVRILKAAEERGMHVILRISPSGTPGWFRRAAQKQRMINQRGRVARGEAHVFEYPDFYEEVGRWTTRLVDEAKASPALLGWAVLFGVSGENNYPGWTDYNPRMLPVWRNWLKNKYGSDAALRRAWNRPDVCIEAATMPKPLPQAPSVIDRRPDFRDWTEFRLQIKHRCYDYFYELLSRQDPNHLLCSFYTVAHLSGCGPDSPLAGTFARSGTGDFEFRFLKDQRIDVFRHAFLPAWDTPLWGRRADLPSVVLTQSARQFAEMLARDGKFFLGEFGGGGINVPPGEDKKYELVMRNVLTWYAPTGSSFLPFILSHAAMNNGTDAPRRFMELARWTSEVILPPAPRPIQSKVAFLRGSWSMSFTYTRTRKPAEWKAAIDHEGAIQLLLDAGVDFDFVTEPEVADGILDRYDVLVLAGIHTFRFPKARQAIVKAVKNGRLRLFLQGPLLEDGRSPAPSVRNLAELLNVRPDSIKLVDAPGKPASITWTTGDARLTAGLEGKSIAFADANLAADPYPRVVGLERTGYRSIALYESGQPAVLVRDNVIFWNPPLGTLHYERRQRNVPLGKPWDDPKPFRIQLMRFVRNVLSHWGVPTPVRLSGEPTYVMTYATRDQVLLMSRRAPYVGTAEIDMTQLGWPAERRYVFYDVLGRKVVAVKKADEDGRLRVPVKLRFFDPLLMRIVPAPAVEVIGPDDVDGQTVAEMTLRLVAASEHESFIVAVKAEGAKVAGGSAWRGRVSAEPTKLRVTPPDVPRDTLARLQIESEAPTGRVLRPVAPFVIRVRQRRLRAYCNSGTPIELQALWRSERGVSTWDGRLAVENARVLSVKGVSLDPEQRADGLDARKLAWRSVTGGGIDGIRFTLTNARADSAIALETTQGTARFRLEDVVCGGPKVFRFKVGTLVIFVRSHGLLSL